MHGLSHGLWQCHYQKFDMIPKFPHVLSTETYKGLHADPTMDLRLETDSHVFFDSDNWCEMLSADLWIIKMLIFCENYLCRTCTLFGRKCTEFERD